jgi:hypothetical protein
MVADPPRQIVVSGPTVMVWADSPVTTARDKNVNINERNLLALNSLHWLTEEECKMVSIISGIDLT